MGRIKMLDAKQSVFFSKQLEHVKTKVYNIEYDDLTYDKVFSVATDVNKGATTIVRRIMDMAGKAKRIAGYAGDLPRVDVTKSEIRNTVITIADSFGYTLDEIDACSMAGENLPTDRAAVARRKIEEEMNDIAWFGDATAGIKGFLNNTDIGSGNSLKAFSAMTASEFLAAIIAMQTAVVTATRGKRKPSKLLLDPTEWTRIMTTPRSDTSDTSIASWIVANTPFLKSLEDIIAIPELLDFDGANHKAAAVLDPSAEQCEIDMPRDITFHTEQEDGLEIVVPVSARYAGLSYMYPSGAYILKNV